MDLMEIIMVIHGKNASGMGFNGNQTGKMTVQSETMGFQDQ